MYLSIPVIKIPKIIVVCDCGKFATELASDDTNADTLAKIASLTISFAELNNALVLILFHLP